MKQEAPPITGRELLEAKSIVSCIPDDIERYRSFLAANANAEAPAGRRERVRVLLTGVPVVHGAERVVELIEDRGGLIVCQENCTGLKPILDDVDENAADPIHALAEKYFAMPCSVMTSNATRLESIERLAGEYSAECVVDLVWQACLTYDVESAQVKRLTEERLHLPFLRIQTDYAPSDSERIAVRIEALFENVRMRRSNEKSR